MNRLVFVLALLWPTLCSAIACEPSTPGASRVIERVTPIGDWRYLWCPVGNKWRLERHVVLAKYRAEPKSMAALMWALATEPDRLSAINRALRDGAIKPSGAQEEHEFALLAYQSCVDATSKPMLVPAIVPPGFCGTEPVLVVTWVVAPNPASTTVPPTRPMWEPTGTKTVAERATVGYSCDCSAPIIKGTQTLCRVTGGVNLAACVRQ